MLVSGGSIEKKIKELCNHTTMIFVIITKYIMISTFNNLKTSLLVIGTCFGLIFFAQSRQPLLESTRDSLTDAVSNMTDVVFNMTDTVVASVMIGFSEKQKHNLSSEYGAIRKLFAQYEVYVLFLYTS